MGLLVSALAVAADTDTVEWSEVNIPTAGRAGGWGLAPGSDLAHLSLAAGVLYADKIEGATSRLMRSEDGGLSWEETDYEGGVVDIVCPLSNAETIYLTDGSHVYKSVDGGEAFQPVSEGTLPAFDANEAISCLDVGYDGASHPIVFIGTADSDTGQYGGVYYLAEGDFGAEWTDMMAEGYDIYAIAAAPEFELNFRLAALACDESHSYIINNEGVIGGWSERTELLKANTTSFALSGASRICFPSGFDIYELFVGVSSGGDGGVYRVNEGGAYDLGLDADIVSLDVAEDVGLELVAGGSQSQLWHSPDAGESWRLSRKAPTGVAVYVVVSADFGDSGVAYAVTSGTESAFSVSRDRGLTWNQTSLVDTEISDIIDLAPSPAYQDNTLFMLTHRDGGEYSLWRRRDGVWERVFCSVLPDVEKVELVALSPQYGDDSKVVLVAGVGGSLPSIWKSNDDGQSFSRYSTPLPVDAWAVVDDSTWFIGGFDGVSGVVYRVINSGLSYSEGVVVGDQSLNSIALSPDYSQDETLLVGNNGGWVYWSEDNGESFEPLPSDAVSAPLSGMITVAFDPDYGDNGTVYAASDSTGEGICRFIIDSSHGWKNIDSPTGGRLGQIVLSAQGALYAANFDTDGGMERCLNPTFSLGPSFESVGGGLDEGAKLVGLWLQGDQLWSIDSAHTCLVSYSDSLTAPISLTLPLDGEPGVGMLIEDSVMNISLDWETLPGATAYQWQLNYETDFSSIPEGFEGTTQSSSVHLADLEPATTYYWRVRAIEPTLSPWSEKWSFSTAMGNESPAPRLENPAAGAEGVSITPIFQWSAIAGADGYELMVSTITTFDNPTILKTDGYALPNTAWQCNISLNYDTTYYWKVRAVSADSCSAWSAVSAFSTEPEPNSPTGSVAEVTQPNTPQESAWPEWLLPMGGILMLVFMITMIAMVIVMIVLVIKVSKL